MNIEKIIEKWKELFSVYDENSENIIFSDVSRLNSQISLALELDETGITGAMILKNSIDDYLDGKDISFKGIIDDRKTFIKIIRLYDELMDLLNSDDLRYSIDAFKNNFKKSILNSGFEINQKTEDFINDEYALAETRLSALNAIGKLRVDQFSSGQRTSNKDMKIKNVIFNFSDINILLRSVKSDEIKDGVYVNLIQDEDNVGFSFFTFFIKNGENIWVISDKPELPQPNYRQNGRGGAINRRFEDRVNSYLFPYELIVEYDKNNKRLVKKQTRESYEKSIQNYAGYYNIVGTLDDCDVQSKIWLFMMFALYQKMFFMNEELPQKQLSYTNMMVQLPEITEQKSGIIRTNEIVKYYEPLELPSISTKITLEDTEDLWERKSLKINQWLFDRYKDKMKNISAEQLIRAPQETLYINKKGLLVHNPPKDFFNHNGLSLIGDVRLTDFGTKEELEKNIKWQAKYTQAKIIQKLANQEYEKRKKPIINWYKKSIEKNMENIKKNIGGGEFFSISHGYLSGFYYGKSETERKNILKIYNDISYSYHKISFHQGDFRKHTCYFTGQNPTIVALFEINNAQAIADICGLNIPEIPDILQHFTKHEPYAGNNILDMVDPLDHIHNPFNEGFDFNFAILMSKRFYNKLVKEYKK